MTHFALLIPVLGYFLFVRDRLSGPRLNQPAAYPLSGQRPEPPLPNRAKLRSNCFSLVTPFLSQYAGTEPSETGWARPPAPWHWNDISLGVGIGIADATVKPRLGKQKDIGAVRCFAAARPTSQISCLCCCSCSSPYRRAIARLIRSSARNLESGDSTVLALARWGGLRFNNLPTG